MTVQELEKAMQAFAGGAGGARWVSGSATRKNGTAKSRAIARQASSISSSRRRSAITRPGMAGNCEAFRGGELLAVSTTRCRKRSSGRRTNVSSCFARTSGIRRCNSRRLGGLVRPRWAGLPCAGHRRGRWLFLVLDWHARGVRPLAAADLTGGRGLPAGVASGCR